MADNEMRTGGMIALLPRAEDAEAMAVRGGDKPDELHLTVCYLGSDVSDWTAGRQNYVASQVAQMASQFGPIEARRFATATFNPDGYEDRSPCAVFLVGDTPVLAAMHQFFAAEVASEEQHSPFIPHVTIGYGIAVTKLGDVGPVLFDRIRLRMADRTYDFPLGEEKVRIMDDFEQKRKFGKGDGGFGKTPAEGDTKPKIENIADLKKAITAFGKSTSDSLKKHIISNARRLKALGELPKDWDVEKKNLFDGFTDFEADKIIEQKVMSANPKAAELREYWAHGGGVKKWRPGTPGDFKRLRRKLAKYVSNPKILDGLTANIHKLATGEWPGKGAHKVASISEQEMKAALLLADPEADLDDDSMASLFAEDVEESEEDDDEFDEYEQALIDDVDWQMVGSSELEREDDGDEDEAENFEDDDVARPLPAGPRVELSLWD